PRVLPDQHPLFADNAPTGWHGGSVLYRSAVALRIPRPQLPASSLPAFQTTRAHTGLGSLLPFGSTHTRPAASPAPAAPLNSSPPSPVLFPKLLSSTAAPAPRTGTPAPLPPNAPSAPSTGSPLPNH